MIGYLVRRTVWAIFVLWFVITAVFFLMNTVGDPAVAQLGPQARAAQVASFRKKHGLDRPILQRYAETLSGLVRGDLGTSFRDESPVAEVIASRLPRTMLLGALAMLIELCIGVGAGIAAAVNRNRWFDTLVMAVAFVGISAPSFVTGLIVLDVIAFKLGLFPVGGYGVTVWDHFYHALLPAFTLAVMGAATYARVMRSELIEAMRNDYVRTARAKGAGPIRVWLVHGVRTALLAIVTLAGLQLSTLVSGAIITETIFAWPGMGRLAVESIYRPDYPMIMGIVVVACAAVQVGNLLADLTVAALDPRVRIHD